MDSKIGIGIIGCGNISSTYLRIAPLFKNIDIILCADLNNTLSRKKAEEFGIISTDVSSLLKSEKIDIVLNLTVPKAHFDVSKSILMSGKHLYSEKPFTLSLNEAIELNQLASENGLTVAGAPDTFLGGSHQYSRTLIDNGIVGKIISGSCNIMSHGMEHWHPNPEFFYQSGGGPMLDLGPYYITNLINLIGPVKRVLGFSSTPQKERIISSQERFGEKIIVRTPTTIHSVLEFVSGAIITMIASWDIWGHGQPIMELYGTDGSIKIPDSNSFSGEIQILKKGCDFEKINDWDHPFNSLNDETDSGCIANYRSAGVSDLANSIKKKIEPRCNIQLITHVVDIMEAILNSAKSGNSTETKTTCLRPKILDPIEAQSMLIT